jgi:Nucleotidyl transferase AbiEii toxin, Type IV TA system
MRYGDARAFRVALEQRLKTGAGDDGARLSRERKYVVFDRLLARLAATAPDRWLLKGGFALDLRLAERARATKDIDIDWQAAEEELLEALIDATAYDAGDFFEFTVELVGKPEDRLGGSHRFRVAAALAGRPFETFLLDVGFRDATAHIEYLTTPGTLTFAGDRAGHRGGDAARAPRRREAPRLYPRLRGIAGQHACEGSRRPRVDRRALAAGRGTAAQRD